MKIKPELPENFALVRFGRSSGNLKLDRLFRFSLIYLNHLAYEESSLEKISLILLIEFHNQFRFYNLILV